MHFYMKVKNLCNPFFLDLNRCGPSVRAVEGKQDWKGQRGITFCLSDSQMYKCAFQETETVRIFTENMFT